MDACGQGNVSEVLRLLDAGADPDFFNAWMPGNVPLIAAARENHAQIVRILVDAGADVDLRDTMGNTALHHASIYGINVVRALLRAGADPNRENHWGATPMHTAAWRGSVGILNELIVAGGDILRTAAGNSTLHFAAVGSKLNAIKLILKEGVDVNAENGDEKETALTLAALQGTGLVIETLLEAGAQVNHRNGQGDTSLIVAAFNGNLEVIKALVENGAQKAIIGSGFRTARDALCSCNPDRDLFCHAKNCKTPQRMTDLLSL